MVDDPREKKLPQWVQTNLARLRHRLHNLEAENAGLRGTAPEGPFRMADPLGHKPDFQLPREMGNLQFRGTPTAPEICITQVNPRGQSDYNGTWLALLGDAATGDFMVARSLSSNMMIVGFMDPGRERERS